MVKQPQKCIPNSVQCSPQLNWCTCRQYSASVKNEYQSLMIMLAIDTDKTAGQLRHLCEHFLQLYTCSLQKFHLLINGREMPLVAKFTWPGLAMWSNKLSMGPLPASSSKLEFRDYARIRQTSCTCRSWVKVASQHRQLWHGRNCHVIQT